MTFKFFRSIFYIPSYFLFSFLFLSLFLFTTFFSTTFAQENGTDNKNATNPIPGCPYLFTRPLQTGSEGIDVKILQQILNSDPRTKVADSGPGSKGQETFSFGVATREALKRLQALFIEYVGIADGKVSPRTVTILNSICNQKKNVEIVNNADKTAPNLKITSATTNFSSNMKFSVESDEPIKKPTPSAVICDGCQVSDIRKLSPTKYSIIIVANEGASRSDVQIEAGKIEDLAGNRNEEASNIIFFRKPSFLQDSFDTVVDFATDVVDTVKDAFSDAVAPDVEDDEVFPKQYPNQTLKFYLDPVTGYDEYVSNSRYIPSSRIYGSKGTGRLSWYFDPNVRANSTYISNAETRYCVINGGDIKDKKVPSIGTIQITPRISTKYDLRCYDANNYKTKLSLYVEVINDGTPSDINISTNSQVVNFGGEIELSLKSGNNLNLSGAQCLLNGGEFKNQPVIINNNANTQSPINANFIFGDSTLLSNNPPNINANQDTNLRIKTKVFKNTLFKISCWLNNKEYSDSILVSVAFPNLPITTSGQNTYIDLTKMLPQIRSGLSPRFKEMATQYYVNTVYNGLDFTLFLRDKQGNPFTLCDQKYTISWGDNSEQNIGPKAGNCENYVKHSYKFPGPYLITLHDSDDKIISILNVSINLDNSGGSSGSDGP